MKTELFLERVKIKHGDNYEFHIPEPEVNLKTSLPCKCKKHNTINYVNLKHFIGQTENYTGCKECNREKRRQQDKAKFISKTISLYGDQYTFEQLNYNELKNGGIITCKEHGDFYVEQLRYVTQDNFVPCPKCREMLNNKERNENYLKRLQEKYRDRYIWLTKEFGDYYRDRVEFICPEHGKVNQTLCVLLNANDEDGYACPKCKKERKDTKQSYTVKDAINKAKELDCCKYYDFRYVTEWKGVKEKYKFVCTKHNKEFEQTFDSIFNNQPNGCPECISQHIHDRCASNTEEFVKKARKIHGDKYDYSKVEYYKNNQPVCIICKEHGEYWQRPYNHLMRKRCPKCAASNLEKEWFTYLECHNIKYDFQKRFDWLGMQSLDFYLPDYNVGIECQGLQHFKPISFGKCEETTDEQFALVKERDERKRKLCEEHGIKVYYYSNLDVEYPYKVYRDKDKLMEGIGWNIYGKRKHETKDYKINRK